MVSVGATSGGGGGGNSCSVDGGRRGLVKGLSRETWKVGEIRYWSGRFSLWLSTEVVAFSPRPHPYLPCFAPLSRERLSLHCSPN